MTQENTDNIQERINELVNAAFDGTITESERVLINQLITDNEENARYYCECIRLQQGLYKLRKILKFETASTVEDLMSGLDEFAQYEVAAKRIIFDDVKQKPEIISKVVYPHSPRQSSRFGLYMGVASAAALFLMVLFLKFAPVKQRAVEVATLIDQIDAQWNQTVWDLENGSRLRSNDGVLDLKKGIVKIQYDEGVDVVIEGPAVFEIEESRILLEYGRLYSHVSQSGIGFTIKTPTSQFIDLGTEFGVQADVNGSSELHVIKGEVQLFAGSDQHKISRRITKNNAIDYDVDQGIVKEIPLAEYAFVRDVRSETGLIWRGRKIFDLADVVGGGNGFGGGQFRYGFNFYAPEQTGIPQVRGNSALKPGLYPVNNPLIDGIFIPDSGGNNYVSSGKHVFADCPVKDSLAPGFIKYIYVFDRCLIETSSAYLANKDNPLEPAINLHSNQGITFDLEAIRESLSGLKVKSFSSEFYIDRTMAGSKQDRDAGREIPKADFYVLIDGQVRLVYKDVTPLSEALKGTIEVKPEDRFLSLVVTQGSDNKTNSDWAFFSNPVLHLEP